MNERHIHYIQTKPLIIPVDCQLTHDMLVDGLVQLLLDELLRVVLVGLQLPPQVDVAVGSGEADGEQAHDEQVAQEPEVRRHLTEESV